MKTFISASLLSYLYPKWYFADSLLTEAVLKAVSNYLKKPKLFVADLLFGFLLVVFFFIVCFVWVFPLPEFIKGIFSNHA